MHAPSACPFASGTLELPQWGPIKDIFILFFYSKHTHFSAGLCYSRLSSSALSCPGLVDMDYCQSYIGCIAFFYLSCLCVLRKQKISTFTLTQGQMLLWYWFAALEKATLKQKHRYWERRGIRFKGNFIKPRVTQLGDNPDRMVQRSQEARTNWETQLNTLSTNKYKKSHKIQFWLPSSKLLAKQTNKKKQC